MFGPENYVRWVDFVPQLAVWSHRILLAYELEEVGESPDLAFEPETKAQEMRIFRKRLVLEGLAEGAKEKLPEDFLITETKKIWSEVSSSAAILASFHLSVILKKFDTIVCSPSGVTLRASEWLLLHYDRLDALSVSVPLRDCRALRHLFEELDSGRIRPREVIDRFCFIDPCTGLIVLKSTSLDAFAHASLLSVVAPERIEALYKLNIEPFLGHSIVWEGKHFPTHAAETLNLIGAFEDRWNVAEVIQGKKESRQRSEPKASIKKRGAKPTGAKDEYYRRYPSGKPSGISFEAIRAELEAAGFKISARQIQNYESSRSI